jgi:hypothetical protein
MPDNCRSDTDTGNTSHMIDTEALVFGNTSSDNSQAEDREAKMYLRRDQNEPATLAPNVERTAAQPFYVNEQPEGAQPSVPRMIHHIILKYYYGKKQTNWRLQRIQSLNFWSDQDVGRITC